MGQTQSEVYSVSEFNEKVSAIAVLLLSKNLDPFVKYTKDPYAVISHSLPLLEGNGEIANYLKYNEGANWDLINRYITENVIDSSEHLNSFLSLLISRLSLAETRESDLTSLKTVKPSAEQTKQDQPQASEKALHVKETSLKSTVQSQSATESRKHKHFARNVIPHIDSTTLNRVAPPSGVRPVKGSTRLQKRLHDVDRAIDVERIAHERMDAARQNIDESYIDVDGDVDLKTSNPTASIRQDDAIRHSDENVLSLGPHDDFELVNDSP